MQQKLAQNVLRYKKDRSRSRVLRRAVIALACAVVFCTTYALILPAITMEKAAVCGLEAHTHSQECYRLPETVKQTYLICSADTLGIHTHTETCYEESGKSVCGYADFLLHTHNDSCFDQNGSLVCSLPEIAEHIHSETCYEQPHVHTAACYTTGRGDLLCTLSDTDPHIHVSECFTPVQKLNCALTEVPAHTHTEACYPYTDILICDQEATEAHTHEAACYAPAAEPSCGLEATEGHAHDESCYIIENQQICPLEEGQTHVHTDSCYALISELTCPIALPAEGALPELICEKPERIVHVHDAACFDADGSLVCALTQLTEHVHDDTCFAIEQILPEEPVLVCEKVQHEHTEACYPTAEDNGDLVPPGVPALDIRYCGIASHTHGDACFNEDGLLMCTMPEHDHNWMCELPPSDTNAVETAEDWEAELPELQGNIAADLIAVAESQLGYTENEANYIIKNDEQLFYSRYADWWSCGEDPYGDWNAKFVAFCLEYAGVTDVPLEPDTAVWPDLLKSCGQWYENNGRFLPISADLVFFDDDGNGEADCVGILGDVSSEDELMTVILERGGKVRQQVCAPDDDDILGYARIPGNFADAGSVQEGWIPVILPEVSEGPVFYISAVYTPQTESYRPYVLRSGSVALYTTPTDMKGYLTEKGGSYFFTLLNADNTGLSKDENGHYIVTPDTTYHLSLSIKSPAGIAPGTYTFPLPEGLSVAEGSGEFTLGEHNELVGTWVIDENGLITMVFNNNMNNRTEVTITASMGVKFSHTDQPIKFDGKITVVIETPPEDDSDAQLKKWGQQGDGSKDRPDPDKIYWTIEILGNKNSRIPGSTVTDILTSGEHSFTDSDRENGLIFMASQRDPVTGEEIPGGWHKWTVPATDITWNTDNSGWSYTIPETVTCKYCGELELGDENWYYWIKYTTTPAETDINGSRYYENTVRFKNQTAVNGTSVQHGDPGTVGIIKDGVFHGDAEGGKFLWEVQATIPGRAEGARAAYFWYVEDTLRVRDDNWKTIGYAENNIDLGSVQAIHDGKIINVPRVQDATDGDMFAWHAHWSNSHEEGIYDLDQIVLLCRCVCTPDSCAHGGYCEGYGYTDDNGEWRIAPFCQCWTVEEDTTFIFTYETDDPSVLERYGGNNNLLWNIANLNRKVPNGSGGWAYENAASADASVPIPGVFKKELTQDYNGYTANYTITVNEAKMQLTEEGSPLTIHDMMSETLAYISGSLVITTEDNDGNIGKLTQGIDYTVTYDGSGNQIVNGAPIHVLDIEILNPQPVKYVLNYDATLIIPSSPDAAVKYSNSATVELWGKTLTVDSTEKLYAELNISAKNYKVQVKKTDAGTGACLPGAVFGLYNEQGGLITSGTTDEKGCLIFETNVIQGVILREHTPYYVQEIAAPPGYALEDAKHWFLFCEEKDIDGNYQRECTYQTAIAGIKKIPGDEIGVFHLTNLQSMYELPETGGMGTTVFHIVGSIMVAAAAVLLAAKKRMRAESESSASERPNTTGC